MKRKALLLLAIASFVMQALPIKAWAGGLDEAQEATSVKTLPYPLENTNKGQPYNIECPLSIK